MAVQNSFSGPKQLILECPFDIETVFTMNYSVDGLKSVLKWVIENLSTCRDDTNK